MPPKKGKGKGKEKEQKKPAVTLKIVGAPPKPKKIPPPPQSFTNEDIMRYKELFKLHDEDNIDKFRYLGHVVTDTLNDDADIERERRALSVRANMLVHRFASCTAQVPIAEIPLMLRKLGFNPKTAEINKMFEMFLEDEFVDTVELHEWYQMIEAKMIWGDDFELAVTQAIAALGHDDEETGFVDFEVFRNELMTWGEPLSEIEFVDWIRFALRDKSYNPGTGTFCFGKFVENMNAKDMRFFKEPINYFKLDQKTLAELAIQKAQKEKEEQEKKEADKRAREEAKRQKMIADGLLPPD